MSKKSFISIIVPVYNGEKFLGACLESLKKQSYENMEIIVVDNGSTDGSASLVTAPAKLTSTSGRTGAGAARNLGAKSAKGDYLLFTDADVEAPQNWVEKTVQTIEERKVKCGGGGYAGPVEHTFIQWFAYEELAWRRRNYYGDVDTLVSNNLFCERKLFESIGGFPEFYRAASSEDMEFSWKVSRENKLWWDKDNGVLHNFTPTAKAYLHQQSRFAQDAVPMLLGNKKMLIGNTHHPKSFYLEVTLTGLVILTPFLMQPLAGAVCALAILIINHGLLKAMGKKHRRGFILKSTGLIYARNATIIIGALRGVLIMLYRKNQS